ncbi:M20/M25/M40 family metallo-hydrolase [Bradyrhizobium sp. LHD-71]|uniref:M20/M25/M40 family metallo-hydrolase n=1 Tax=Bradyrhizobium sp. LHD-71 TaxID=3072141 RepID=UPI00280DE032|nr:M20/M25/M40 family metallo-hydrolase [Bradyrhizobium sp. LHD-71]MDQ8731891.1 M20/M25/M40 family metallo-hydrolase [Bradyrhizobium sp. LHD-71]
MVAKLELSDVLAHVDAQRETSLHRLMDYVRHPSISAHNIGIKDVAELLVDMLSKLGLEARLVPSAGHPMVVARWLKAEGAPTVLLYGHYDVQPPDPLDLWLSPPFEPTIRDGRIFARGVADNKGQHFAQILAIESHLKVHGRLPCNVILLLEGEEEIGSPHIADFVRDHRDLLKADLAVTADGPLHPSGRPTLKLGSRGVISFDLHARHASRDVHSGNFGGVVPNPLWTLVHLLATMKNDRGEITIEGFDDDVLAPTEEECEAVARLPLDLDEIKRSLGLSRLDEPAGRDYYERLCFRPTLTINGLHGGYGGPGSKTVLPHEAIAKCDIRLVAAQDTADILRKVEAHVHKHAPEVTVVSHGSGMQPSKTPINSSYAAPIRQAIVAAHGIEPLIYPAGFGSLPGYAFTQILGIDAFVTPYGNADEANHAPNENLKIECFFNGIRTGAALLDTLGKANFG